MLGVGGAAPLPDEGLNRRHMRRSRAAELERQRRDPRRVLGLIPMTLEQPGCGGRGAEQVTRAAVLDPAHALFHGRRLLLLLDESWVRQQARSRQGIAL